MSLSFFFYTFFYFSASALASFLDPLALPSPHIDFFLYCTSHSLLFFFFKVLLLFNEQFANAAFLSVVFHLRKKLACVTASSLSVSLLSNIKPVFILSSRFTIQLTHYSVHCFRPSLSELKRDIETVRDRLFLLLLSNTQGFFFCLLPFFFLSKKTKPSAP